jgi:hypothetical protein
MLTNLSLFDEFLLHLQTLRNAAKGEPRRVVTFYDESQAVRDAVIAMRSFLARTDFERRVFHGARIMGKANGTI